MRLSVLLCLPISVVNTAGEKDLRLGKRTVLKEAWQPSCRKIGKQEQATRKYLF